MALMIHFNFKPHELTCISLTTYTGLAWQFNYQKSRQKKYAPTNCWDVKFIYAQFVEIWLITRNCQQR